MGKGRGDTRAKKDADESDPMKKLKKTGSGAKEDKTEKLDSLKKSKRGKKDADENDLVKKSKVPGTGERDDKINDDSLKSEKPRGREKKIGSDLKNARPSNSIADKENGKKGKEKANKKEKQTPLNETDLNAKSEIEKKGKKTNDEKGQGTKYKQAQHSEIEEPKFDKKSKNLDKKENTNIDAKKKNRKSNRDTTGAHERDSREPDKDQKYKLNRKGDIRSSRRTGQNIRNRKSGRTLSRGNSRSRLGKGIKGSKFIQDNRRSNINESYSRRPSRVDEVRTCDILRVHLEKRDLSRWYSLFIPKIAILFLLIIFLIAFQMNARFVECVFLIVCRAHQLSVEHRMAAVIAFGCILRTHLEKTLYNGMPFFIPFNF